MQEEYGIFAQHFVANFAPEILNTYLRQVQLYVAGQAWLSKKCQYLVFTFFCEWWVFFHPFCLSLSPLPLINLLHPNSIKPKSTWTLLKPSFETLVSSFVFPQLSFNATKQALWESDPVDYVRISVGTSLFKIQKYKGLNLLHTDEYENFATPVSAATSFLFSLASNRTKTTFMPILGFVNTVLRSYVPFSPPSNSPPTPSFHNPQIRTSPTKIRSTKHDCCSRALHDATPRS